MLALQNRSISTPTFFTALDYAEVIVLPAEAMIILRWCLALVSHDFVVSREGFRMLASSACQLHRYFLVRGDDATIM